ncbi:MAG TPA: acetylxylan esterase [Thermoguttaceae bacterium]|nr:acetylxylan esterase [Thermoguttaceae bacterium]
MGFLLIDGKVAMFEESAAHDSEGLYALVRLIAPMAREGLGDSPGGSSTRPLWPLHTVCDQLAYRVSYSKVICMVGIFPPERIVMNRCLKSVCIYCWLVTIALVVSAQGSTPATARFTGPWNLDELNKVPSATWGEKTNNVQQVYYQGEPVDGKPTRVFAYYACPAESDGPVPGMVLVHGGGGTAFAEWATLWAERGYAALAMDLGGCGPNKERMADGMPAQGHPEKFLLFENEEEARRLWTYHAVAAVIRGHSLLASREEVDATRTGLTGISWGGYLTCIVAGVDDRFKVAAPVYGCGFLHENSCWLGQFAQLGPEQTKRWVAYYDPSRYLPGVRCPILFLNGTNDFAYPLDSYQKSYRAVPGPVDLHIEVRMPHGHPQGWAPREIGLYVDSVLLGGDPLPKLGPLKIDAGHATATFQCKVPVTQGQLHYTTDGGEWQTREWKTVDAKLTDGKVFAELPQRRPLVFYLSVTDDRGAMISTEHAELPQ